MLRSLLASVVLASAGASRIQEHSGELKTQDAFGATCEFLQTRFHTRVAAFQESVDTMQEDDMSRVTQTRLTMRTYGIIRTLRRAKSCDWVMENDSTELDQVRAVVQTLLAGNPCAEAARSEMESGTSAETAEVEMATIRRAMSVLLSDSCDPTELPEPENNGNQDADLDANLVESEDNLADAIDDMEESESSFIQMKSNTGFFQHIMRAIGVVFLMMIVLLACASAAYFIAIMMAFMMAFLGAAIAVGLNLFMPLHMVGFAGGGLVGGALGLATCLYQTYTLVMSPSSNGLSESPSSTHLGSLG